MVLAFIALQLAGLAGLYLVLRRRIDRNAQGAGELPQLRSQVAALIVELNGTAERNISLLEDRIRQLDELLRKADRRSGEPRRADRHGNALEQPLPAGSAQEREAQVMRLRRLGFTSAVIADRLATSKGEVELIVNLAADRSPVPRPPGARKPAPRTTEA